MFAGFAENVHKFSFTHLNLAFFRQIAKFFIFIIIFSFTFTAFYQDTLQLQTYLDSINL